MDAAGGSQPHALHVYGLHRRPGGAAVPVPRRPHDRDGGVVARGEKSGTRGGAALARQRGLQIFALAFLFRLQSQLLGWGAFSNFLKVDILNVMGIAMIAAAILWGVLGPPNGADRAVCDRDDRRGHDHAACPGGRVLAALPDPIEAYIRPLPGRTNFALFPWAGVRPRRRDRG